jgi:tricorn protease
MNNKKSIVLTLFLLLVSFTFAMKDARLLRFPDINGNRIVFVYAGDIWTVPATGGDAKRLTSHIGFELFPKISPDGKWIAFSAEYSGSRQIYIIPSDGGIPKQLTYYNDVGVMPPRGGWDYAVLDWTPDSKKILIRANRTPYGKRMGKYYLVPIDGGLETPLEIPEAGFGKFSPDATKIVYTPISREFRTWKRTKGGRAQDIWIYNLIKHKSKRITKFPGTDQHPLWYKDKIYFVSDRGPNARLNFHSYDLKTGSFSQITHHKDFDVLWPSGRAGVIVYENGGYIYKLNLDTGKTEKLTINIDFDNPNRLPYFKNVAKYVSRFGYGISPTGKRVVFDARGDIWTVPAKKGITYNLTDSQGVKDSYPAWSPDGKWILYYSDKTGEYEIYLTSPKGKKNIQLTKNSHTWRFPAVWSPDSTKILFSDKNQNFQFMDIKTKEITIIDKAKQSDITDYEWSPDSQWIVYTKGGSNGLEEIWVYSIKDNKKRQLTSNEYNNFSPVFSNDGKYIYFLSLRTFNMNFSSYEFDFVYNKATKIYAVALTKNAPKLFKDENDEEPAKSKNIKTEKKGKTKKNLKKEKSIVKIDFEGINDRVVAFPLRAGNYGGLAPLKGGILYFKSGGLYKYDIKKRKSILIIKGISDGKLTADGKNILYKAGSKYGIIPIAPNQKIGNGLISLKDITMKINPVKEWNEMFKDGWRLYRDWFYVKNMHAVNWTAMYEKYKKLLPYIGHRADLDYIFGELIGELNVGHCYVHWGDFPKVKRIDTGLLGAELVADNKAGRYKIAKIYKGENWNERTRSPLTEQGINIKEGNYIIKLNNHELTLKDNPYKFLENTVGKLIPITVNSKPTLKGAKTYLIKPIKSELALKHLDWVNSRKTLVDKLSQGRIGYVYVPDTAVDGNRELFKGFYAQRDKEALIVDERYNGGGWSPGKMIELLSRKIVSYWRRRGLELRPEPFFAINGPKIMLINHYSSSGGDNFPYWFRKANLGLIIGTRSWGGLVGYGWSPSLEDGGNFAIPSSGIVGTNGKYIVEGVGIYPDIEVEDRPELVAQGHDPSLERAVNELLKQLKKHPVKKTPKNPPDPNRSKWYDGVIK